MPKYNAFLLLLIPAAFAFLEVEQLSPWDVVEEAEPEPSSVSWPSETPMPVLSPRHQRPDHFGGDNDFQVTEFANLPAKIPLYAGMVVQDQYHRQSPYSETCDAPEGRGLKNLLRQAEKLMPLTKIEAIITASIAHDQQVQSLITLINSQNFRSKIKATKQSLEFHALVDYACKILNLDIRDAWRFHQLFLDWSRGDYVAGVDEFKGRPGILGLLQDIRTALPRQELKDLFQKMMSTDDYLSGAVRQLRSTDFHQLLEKLRNLPQFLEVHEQLVSVGVPLEEVRDLIRTALGWGADELDSFNEELKI